MGTERELIYLGLLPAQVKDSDLRIRNASAEARLGVRLVLAVAVAGRENMKAVNQFKQPDIVTLWG